MKTYLVIECDAPATKARELETGKGLNVAQNILRELHGWDVTPTAFKVIESNTFPAGNVIATLPTKATVGA